MTELEDLNLDHPEQSLLSNLENDDNRFIGVYGYTIELPSVPEKDKIYFMKKYDVRIINGTSDVIESERPVLFYCSSKGFLICSC